MKNKLTIIFIIINTFLFAQKQFDTKVYGQQILEGKIKYDGIKGHIKKLGIKV